MEISRLQYSVLRNFIVPTTDWYGKHYETVRTILRKWRRRCTAARTRPEARQPKPISAAYPDGVKLRTVTDGGAIRKRRRSWKAKFTNLGLASIIQRASMALDYATCMGGNREAGPGDPGVQCTAEPRREPP
eukprot:COSAG02_NODE_28818_length_581_cov_7.919087_1_plen_131_part_10